MFPATITLHNAADLQKVMSVLYPTAGVVEITDKTRDTQPGKTNDADLQTTVNNAEAKHAPQSTKAAESKPAAQTAPTEPTVSADKGDAQEQSASGEAKTWDYEKEIKPRVLALIRGGKREKVAAVFKQFGVANAQEIKADKHDAFMAEIAKLEG